MGEWLDYYDNMSLQYNIDKCDLNVKTLEQCENTHPDEVSGIFRNRFSFSQFLLIIDFSTHLELRKRNHAAI